MTFRGPQVDEIMESPHKDPPSNSSASVLNISYSLYMSATFTKLAVNLLQIPYINRNIYLIIRFLNVGFIVLLN
jgi:hypothetical protein